MAETIRGTSLLLDGLDCLHLAGPLGAYLMERARRDGGVPPQLRVIVQKVQAVASQYRAETLAGSGMGTHRFRNEALDASCVTSTTSTWLTAEAAATLLNCSASYVRRLCRQRTLRSVRAAGKGAWLIDESAVLERVGARDRQAVTEAA